MQYTGPRGDVHGGGGAQFGCIGDSGDAPPWPSLPRGPARPRPVGLKSISDSERPAPPLLARGDLASGVCGEPWPEGVPSLLTEEGGGDSIQLWSRDGSMLSSTRENPQWRSADTSSRWGARGKPKETGTAE